MSETAKSFWHSAGYIPWFTADTASAVGAALRALAISLLGYAVSGSTIAAGWLGTSSMIAQQVASVFGGTFVDRHDRNGLSWRTPSSAFWLGAQSRCYCCAAHCRSPCCC